VSPDPDVEAWRQVAADLGALAQNQVRESFEWIDRCIVDGRGAGVAALLLGLQDLQAGRPLRRVLLDLIDAADAERTASASR